MAQQGKDKNLKFNMAVIWGLICAEVKNILYRLRYPNSFKAYVWHFDGDVKTFFEKFRAKVPVHVKGGWSYIQWVAADGFILGEKSEDRFVLWYQRQFGFNFVGGITSLYGKATQTQGGVTVVGELRMDRFIYHFCRFWVGFCAFFILILASTT